MNIYMVELVNYVLNESNCYLFGDKPYKINGRVKSLIYDINLIDIK